MTDEPQELLLAVRHAESLLLETLLARAKVFKDKPTKVSETDSKVKRALEVVLNCYRCGGCTSGQIKDLEKIRDQVKEMAQ